ncbi:FprA family A-type flavoprotein [Methanobacterium spitsbergense]|uniref:FprA family A-type flavoprotein n=1 Tax=Methanobacterium spitsbergense TaxID=2874285 RepID=A0A8T5UXU0_9EURY|nr:FprA family A-type flavoprotein [Methanobacterium spitsbergense]MBZ2165990.1 FprA family A-type flavoprotein [Methanobacterium spitsbergense]
MTYNLIKEQVYSVGAIDWDRRIFDELINIPNGTSYNSFIVKGKDKTALIDTVDPTKTNELRDNLKKLDVDIDYIVINHAEQDHSGTIPKILKKYSDAIIVTNTKCKEFLSEFLPLTDANFRVVGDGDSLDLGGKTLEFIITPWVHWPDTMVTYLNENKILFSCDFFGSHLATSELFSNEDIYKLAKRYYAEIMMPFRTIITKNLEKLENLNIDIIAPSHGPLYKNPEFIMNAYKDWTSNNTKNEVIIPYISMHGSTKRMVEYLVDSLIDRGITVKPLNLTLTESGELALDLVDATTMVIASPTVLTGPHPSVVYATYLANALRPKLKLVSVMGSYGWGGRMLDLITGMIGNLKVEMISPLIIKGFPKEEDYKKIEAMANEIVSKHEELGIIEKR